MVYWQKSSMIYIISIEREIRRKQTSSWNVFVVCNDGMTMPYWYLGDNYFMLLNFEIEAYLSSLRSSPDSSMLT